MISMSNWALSMYMHKHIDMVAKEHDQGPALMALYNSRDWECKCESVS